MTIPDRLHYSTDHEWVSVEDGRARIGITDYAQDALGDVVFVDVPTVGRTVAAGESMSEVESTKSVSDIYAPVSGTLTAVNDLLAAQPDLLNRDPYGDGWIFKIEFGDPSDLDGLMDADGYRALTEG